MRTLLRAASEAAACVDLSELATRTLPHLASGLHASFAACYRVTDSGLECFMPPAQDATLIDDYVAHFMHEDPCQEVKRRLNPRIAVVSELVDKRQYRHSMTYNEFYRPIDIESHLLIRLNDTSYPNPGVIALLISRSHRQDTFDRRDLEALAQIAPALTGVARRHDAWSYSARRAGGVEAALETLHPDPCFVFDAAGRMVWMSVAAERYCTTTRPVGRAIPPCGLSEAVARLSNSLACGAQPAAQRIIVQHEKSELEVELLPSRMPPSGEPCVVARVMVERDPIEAVLAHRGLTAGEVAVVRHLLRGLSNKEIAQALFVSPETIKTHLRHVFQKLNVSSRTQIMTLVNHARWS